MKSGLLESKPHCPRCKELIDGFTSVDHDHAPKAGDVSICCYCSAVLQFNDDMRFKLAAPDVIEECSLLEISRGQRRAKEFRAALNLKDKIRKAIAEMSEKLDKKQAEKLYQE